MSNCGMPGLAPGMSAFAGRRTAFFAAILENGAHDLAW